MRSRILLTTLLAATVAGCDSILDVDPVNEIVEESAIVDENTALAAAAGMYDALQDGEYYGGDYVWFGDLSSEDVMHTGTFTTFRQADQNNLTADNSTIESMWDQLYITIGRANTVIAKVPNVDMDEEVKSNILGEAYFIRALTYHNLLRFWGERDESGLGVPLRLEPAGSVGEASDITRATTGEVYDQILADLDMAEDLITDNGSVTRASDDAVRAIRARVLLYRGDWAAAEAAAEAVEPRDLADDFRDLFDPDGIETSEDIFKVAFTAVEYSLEGYYYLPYDAGGRGEVGPSQALIRAFVPTYNGTEASFATPDQRAHVSIDFLEDGTPYATKWPTGVGAEDVHVIRYAEVLLIQAEAEARQNELTDAINTLNIVRARAGLAPLNAVGMTQDQVLDAILHERRLELAMEGDRWPDLVRRGVAQEVVGFDEAHQVLYPIPLNEIDIVPQLQQNPGD